MQGLRIPVIIVIFVSVLGLAILTESLVHGRQVTSPLVSTLQTVPGVTDARVDGRGKSTAVHVHLADGIDLITVFPQLIAIKERYLGPGMGNLHVSDARNEKLTRVYYDLRFQIEEALATGHFTRMASEVAEAALMYSLTDHHIFMDSDNVYLQLHQGEAYLYEVVPRRSEIMASNHS